MLCRVRKRRIEWEREHPEEVAAFYAKAKADKVRTPHHRHTPRRQATQGQTAAHDPCVPTLHSCPSLFPPFPLCVCACAQEEEKQRKIDSDRERTIVLEQRVRAEQEEQQRQLQAQAASQPQVTQSS